MANTKKLDHILRKKDFLGVVSRNLKGELYYTKTIIEVPTGLIATVETVPMRIFYDNKHVGATSQSKDGHLVYGFTNRPDIANNLDGIPLYNLDLRD